MREITLTKEQVKQVNKGLKKTPAGSYAGFISPHGMVLIKKEQKEDEGITTKYLAKMFLRGFGISLILLFAMMVCWGNSLLKPVIGFLNFILGMAIVLTMWSYHAVLFKYSRRDSGGHSG
jgi:Ca2+/Na+ antiporter